MAGGRAGRQPERQPGADQRIGVRTGRARGRACGGRSWCSPRFRHGRRRSDEQRPRAIARGRVDDGSGQRAARRGLPASSSMRCAPRMQSPAHHTAQPRPHHANIAAPHPGRRDHLQHVSPDDHEASGPTVVEKARSSCSTEVAGVLELVLHELAGGLGDRAGERRVDRDRVGQLVTVRWFSTAIAIGRISSLALGATTTPPMTRPEAGRQNSFTKPSWRSAILARALPASGSITARAGTRPESTSDCETPTVASSGSVKTLAETVLQPQRGDRLAERVPHRDPALHGGDAGQRQHAGAVAGGVDAGHVGTGDPVDGHVAAGADARRRTRPGPARPCWAPSRPPSARASRSTVAPVGQRRPRRRRRCGARRRPGRCSGSSCRASGTRSRSPSPRRRPRAA